MTKDDNFNRTKRTTLKRLPLRARYDRNSIYDILDEGFVCHVGFMDAGRPVVIPTAYGRLNDMLYIHGSVASRMLRTVRRGTDVCVTVTILDGLVLARSAFHHSMNYRSVVVFGTASAVEDKAEKITALRTFSEHVIPRRWEEVREPNEAELKATCVLRLPLSEASAKVRSGPPIDDEADYQLPVWAGELPLSLVASAPVVDPQLHPNLEVPASVLQYRRNSHVRSTRRNRINRA